MSLPGNETEIQLLLAKCIGREVKIPNLFLLYPWEVKVSPPDEKLEMEVELWRSRFINDSTSLKRNRAVDPCLFARGGAPDADFDGLVNLAKWAAWIYYWDDAYDLGEFDDKSQEVAAHLEQTIELVRQSLSNQFPSRIDPATIAPTYPTAQSIHEWASWIGGERGLSPAFKRWIFKVVTDYCKAASRLTTEFYKGTTLDLETYHKIRTDSSGVLPTFGATLAADNIALPDWFFDHELFEQAGDLVNIIVWVSNDVISVWNELRVQHVDNLIPLLVYHKQLTPQEAVDEACGIIHQAYLDFEVLIPQLIQLGEDRNITSEMRRFIASCKFTCTGLLHWSYNTRRYVLWETGMDHGSTSVVFGQDLPKRPA
ncbi:terpenoid synthase [Hypoxylon rubiginosum]|uniref:Terpenoid synthase n=1 Tax=Hypoxylon rubiginosum TaxID=110542 RepID=A0ACC0DG39_9PEZI|nr:terpenoid synthase [Hypoxylon rubiginosum]